MQLFQHCFTIRRQRFPHRVKTRRNSMSDTPVLSACGVLIYIFHDSTLLSHYVPPDSIASFNQPRAKAKWRWTVGAETLMVLAVCSIVRPAKYLSRTTRAASGSTPSKRVIASLRIRNPADSVAELGSGRLARFYRGPPALRSPTHIGGTPSGMVDQNPAHRVSGSGVEMALALPGDPPWSSESQIGLIDQRGCLKRVTGPFVAQLSLGDGAQLIIDQRQKKLKCAGVGGFLFR